MLDLGCGAGNILSYLPAIQYTGVDLSPKAVTCAQERYGTKARFVCADVIDFLSRNTDQYDLVMAIGFLHHFDDGAVRDLFRELNKHMDSNSRMITVDGCREGDPSFVERGLLRVPYTHCILEITKD